MLRNYLLCSQTWLPTVQEVLQADWQEAGHSPQPPVRRVFFSIALLTVWICFLMCITSKSKYYYSYYPVLLPFARAFSNSLITNYYSTVIDFTFSKALGIAFLAALSVDPFIIAWDFPITLCLLLKTYPF